MLRRDIKDLTAEYYDVLVIGGGINGAALAWESATRGLKTLLVERRDFGSGATAGNFRTIHGGLRYLQHLDLTRLWESVREQAFFLRAAPHLVQPLPFLIPCYGRGMKGKRILDFALSTYELLAFGRNVGVRPELQLPKHRALSVEETVKLAPGIERAGLEGGVMFFDAIMNSPDRLTLAFVKSAVAAGAKCLNYVSAESAEEDSAQTIRRVICRDELRGEEHSVLARMVINATGPWAEYTQAKLLRRELNQKPIFSKGVQLLLQEQITTVGVAVASQHRDQTAVAARGGRSYFILPWRGKSILGTADILHTDRPDAYSALAEEGERFLAEIRASYSDPRLIASNVTARFGGLRPVEPSVEKRWYEKRLADYGSVEAGHRDRVLRYGKNLTTVIGIKYTTARGVAEGVIDRIEYQLRGRNTPSLTRDAQLVGGESDRGEIGVPDARRLFEEYGGESVKLAEYLSGDGGDEVISGLLRAEVLFAVRDESAQTVEDLLLRRSAVGTERRLSSDEVRKVVEVMAAELGWSEGRRQAEVDSLSGL